MHKIKEAVAPKNESTTQSTGSAEYGSSTTGANTGYGSQSAKTSEYGSGGASSGIGSHNLGSNEYGSTGRTSGTGGTGAGYGNPDSQSTAGPHSSNMANKVDPRVDSDLDNSRTMGRDQTYNTGTTGSGYGSGTGAGMGAVGGMGSTGTHTGSHGMGSSGMHGTHGTGSGPHQSNVANKLDPRVDSDRDGSTTMGRDTYGTQQSTGHGALGGGGIRSGNTQNAGPHQSNMANKLDPRVDSDRDGSATAGRQGAGYGAGNTGTGYGNTTGSGYGAGNTGSGYGNTGSGAAAGAGSGAGAGSAAGAYGNPASRNTAGPHGSDIANKLDPRVDSNLDGSKTMGRDQTFSRS